MNLTKYKRLLENHIENGFVFYFSLMIIFITGVVIGSVMIKLLDTEIQEKILNYTSVYFHSFNNNLLNLSIFKTCLLFRTITIMVMYIIGLLNIGILIPILILVQGGALGFNVGYIINYFGFKGFLISIFAYFPQHVIFIPSLIILGALSMTMANKYKLSSNKRVFRINKMNVFEYTIFNIIFSCFVLIGILYEGYIAPIFLNMIT